MDHIRSNSARHSYFVSGDSFQLALGVLSLHARTRVQVAAPVTGRRSSGKPSRRVSRTQPSSEHLRHKEEETSAEVS